MDSSTSNESSTLVGPLMYSAVKISQHVYMHAPRHVWFPSCAGLFFAVSPTRVEKIISEG